MATELEVLEARIKDIYEKAYPELKATWDEAVAILDNGLQDLMTALAEAKKIDEKSDDVKRLKRQIKRNRIQRALKNRHYQNMMDEISSRLTRCSEIAQAYINNSLPRIYVKNYNNVGKAIENGLSMRGYSFELVDESTVKNLIAKDSALLPMKYADSKATKEYIADGIRGQITQGIIQGESIEKISMRIANVTNSEEKYSVRTARTAVTCAENKGRQDSLEKAQEDGVILKKRWICSHDGRTRDTHLAIDREEVGIDDEFSNGCRYPGDPSAPPEEVYNCRCTMISVVKGFKG